MLRYFSYKYINYLVFRYKNNISKHLKNFTILYSNTNGFTLSKQAREQCDAMEYVYGEVLFESFIALLSLTQPDEYTIFYDLGSGVGKAVIACAMVYPIKKSVGIELFNTLHHSSLTLKNKLCQNPDYCQLNHKINFINSDFMHPDISITLQEATHIFIHSTGFFGETWLKISAYLATLPNLKKVITISKPLKHPQFTISKTTYVAMSWGVAEAFIHQKC